MPRKNISKKRVYWWNFKKAVRKVWIVLGIFFILSAGTAVALQDFNASDTTGAATGAVLFVALILGMRASFKGDWWDDEEDIRDEKKKRSGGGWGTGNPGDIDDYFWDDDW